MDHRPGRLPLPVASLAVPLVAGLGAVAFLAWKPGVARSLLGSPRAAAFTLVVGGLVLGAGWLLPRLGWGTRSTALVQAVPVALAFTLTVLPVFGDTVVRESFPMPGPSQAGAPSAGPASPSASPTTAEVVARGSFTGIDHRASGDVLLVAPADGPAVVRLEALDRPLTVLIWCRAFAVPVAAATLG